MTLFNDQIDRWYLKFHQYFFRYTKGFFELPVLVNSPEVMVEGFSKMTFTRYDKERHLVTSNTPFMKTELIHLDLENGLTLFLSRSLFRKNIKFKFFYDKTIPSEHYFLAYQITRKEMGGRSGISNGISHSTNTWLFYKPGSRPDSYFFKDTRSTFIIIYFTSDWLNKFLDNCDGDQKKSIEYFIQSDQEYMIYPCNDKNFDTSLFENAITDKAKVSELSIPVFRSRIYNILDRFLTCLSEGPVSKGFFELSNSERMKIVEAERYLRNNLTSNFPGIEEIADKVGMGQTSLKDGFKMVYGKPLYKYFQAEKMQLAAERLAKNPDLKIGTLASEMGYGNAGKFAAAFKENIGVAPSEYIESQN